MKLKELLKQKLDVTEMMAIWFPPEIHKIIKYKALDTGLPIYKYIMSILIEKEETEERDLIALQKHEVELKRTSNK